MDKLNQIKVINEISKEHNEEGYETRLEGDDQLLCTIDFYNKVIATEVTFTGIKDMTITFKEEKDPLKIMELDKNFPNLEILTLDCHKDDWDPLFVDLNPLLKLNHLRRLDLIGNCLSPYGLGSDWKMKLGTNYGGKVNFKIDQDFNLNFIPGIARSCAPMGLRGLVFNGWHLNFFDEIDFNLPFKYVDIKDPNLHQIEIIDFVPIDQWDQGKGKKISLKPLEHYSKVENLIIDMEEILVAGDWEDREKSFFDFDNFPNFPKLKYFKFYDKVFEGDYDFIIQKFSEYSKV